VTERETYLESSIAEMETMFADRMPDGVRDLLDMWNAELNDIVGSRARREQALADAGVVAHGICYYTEDQDSGNYWFLIDRSASRPLHKLQDMGVPLQYASCHNGDYDCCGHTFYTGARLRRTPGRLLVKVGFGTDV
jgi:hypothetical protein